MREITFEEANLVSGGMSDGETGAIVALDGVVGLAGGAGVVGDALGITALAVGGGAVAAVAGLAILGIGVYILVDES